jgi:transposase-like protein
MPQLQLPMFPIGVTHITSMLAFQNEAGNITYFNGSLPVFSHREDDRQSFKMITAQFCANGHALQADIARAFGVTAISVKRSVKLYRKEGARGFYQPRKARGASVLTPAVLDEVQQLLNADQEVADIAAKLDIKSDTLSKAIRSGRLHQRTKKKPPKIS